MTDRTYDEARLASIRETMTNLSALWNISAALLNAVEDASRFQSERDEARKQRDEAEARARKLSDALTQAYEDAKSTRARPTVEECRDFVLTYSRAAKAWDQLSDTSKQSLIDAVWPEVKP
jgi:transposase